MVAVSNTGANAGYAVVPSSALPNAYVVGVCMDGGVATNGAALRRDQGDGGPRRLPLRQQRVNPCTQADVGAKVYASDGGTIPATARTGCSRARCASSTARTRTGCRATSRSRAPRAPDASAPAVGAPGTPPGAPPLAPTPREMRPLAAGAAGGRIRRRAAGTERGRCRT